MIPGRRAVVITSVLPPSADVADHCARADRDGDEVVVVADEQTPVSAYHDLARAHPALTLLTLEDQALRFPDLARLAPVRHYARKNMGYAHAIARGCRFLLDTDDDNVCPGAWGTASSTRARVVRPRPEGLRFVNVYAFFTEEAIWPRGFPLELVMESRQPPALEAEAAGAELPVAALQGLVDGDPDVDALFRLTHPLPAPFAFTHGADVVLDERVLCPMNSQNVTWCDPAVFDLLYLPSTVTMRVCDILRGYVAQHCLWPRGKRVGFTGPTARQARNPHDLLKDFAAEVPLYLDAARLNHALHAVSGRFEGTSRDLRVAYEALADARIVEPRELERLDAWLRAIAPAPAR